MAPNGAEELCPKDREGVAADRRSFLHYMKDEDEDEDEDSSAVATQGHDNYRSDIYDEVENFYLQSGAAAVSIMQLPLCVGEEVVSEVDGYGEGQLTEIYLVGQSVRESREIRVLAEKWKLDLHPNAPPTLVVKTAYGWLRVQKPKVAYRRIMTDGLTLAHFLHFARKYPSASASALREYLSNQFRQFGEEASLEKLSEFFPVIRRYMKADMMVENPHILRELFPDHFRDVVASSTLRDMNGRNFQEEEFSANGYTSDLNEGTPREVKHREAQGVKRTSKTTKAQRASVNAELRNLHSQWCTLLGGQAAVKADKKPASNRSRPSERQNSASRKSGRPKSVSKKSGAQNPVSNKPERQNDVPKRGRPSAADCKNRVSKRRRSSSECKSAVSKKGLTSTPSLESKTTALDKQSEKSRPSAKLLNTHTSEETTMNLKRRKEEIKLEPAENRAPAPSTVMVGVHLPSTDIFDRLEDPPICTICDDGGDLICCEGPCQRHFHATLGTDTPCKTLGLTSEQVKIDTFYCNNCVLKQHQCFICQKLGFSAPSPRGPQEVYICDAPGCKKFYHAGCVAKVLGPELDWRAVSERIERGLHGFLCPRHSCAVCTSMEIEPGIFVQCRRCPKAWHRDCLTDVTISGELPETSIWKHYDREFIYCKKHEILPQILTPAQDHVKFPKE